MYAVSPSRSFTHFPKFFSRARPSETNINSFARATEFESTVLFKTLLGERSMDAGWHKSVKYVGCYLSLLFVVYKEWYIVAGSVKGMLMQLPKDVRTYLKLTVINT